MSAFKASGRQVLADLLIITFLAIVIRILLSFLFSFSMMHYDSSEYLAASRVILEGQVHASRLPVFPAIIHLAGYVFSGLSLANAVLLFQSIFGVLLGIPAYLLASRVFRNRLYAVLATLLVVCNPYVISWEFSLMTESISLFLLMVGMYFLMKYLDTSRSIYLYLTAIVLIIGVFTKLLFLVLFILFIAGAIIFVWGPGKRSYVGIHAVVIMLVSIFLISSYARTNEKQNGIRSISMISKLQWYLKVYDYQLYELMPDHPFSEHMVNARKKGMDHWEMFNAHKARADVHSLLGFSDKLFCAHPMAYILKFSRSTLKNVSDASLNGTAVYYIKVPHSNAINYDLQTVVPILFVILLSGIDLALMVFGIHPAYRRDGSGRFWMLADLTILLTFALGAVGSFYEYARFLFPVYALIIFLYFRWFLIVMKYLFPRIIWFKLD